MFTRAGYLHMKLNWIVLLLTALLFFVVSFLILYDQYTQVGVWFQFSDLHHETFALSFFALAVGILIGGVIKK
jgi:cytochrome c-type biogenesis protein CcmH/NrfG